MAQAGKGADGGGVVSQHILRIMAGSARPTWLRSGETPVLPVGSERAIHRVAPTFIQSYPFSLCYDERKGFEYFLLLMKTHPSNKE
jgi:hypothetical protein